MNESSNPVELLEASFTDSIDDTIVLPVCAPDVLDQPWMRDALGWTGSPAESVEALAGTPVGTNPRTAKGTGLPRLEHYDELFDRAERVARDTAGGFLANGRVTSSLFWFAKLYEIITDVEVEMLRSGLSEPGTGRTSTYFRPLFVAHFIPVFYELYRANLRRHLLSDPSAIPPHWRAYFQQCQIADDTSLSPDARLLRIPKTLEYGVYAHIRGDMASALVQAVRSYRERWPDDRTSFDDIEEDFLVRGVIVFPVVMRRMTELFADIHRLPVELVRRANEAVSLGPELLTVYSWRRQAFADARRQLAAG